MADLSPDQFSVFSKMGEMDREFAHPVSKDPNSKFFHGTKAVIKDRMVRPAQDVDRNPSEYSMGDPGDMSEGDHAFVIRNDENYAWHAARIYSSGGGRPKVYETDPAPDMKPGPWNKDHPDFIKHHELDIPEGMEYDKDYHEAEVAKARANHQDEWGSPTGFPVRKRIDIMPGHQGTFPQINWNRHAETRGDVNHPNDEQVKYGTAGHPLGRTGSEDPRRFRPVEPEGRQGRSFREFMEGKPVQPNHGHPTLF